MRWPISILIADRFGDSLFEPRSSHRGCHLPTVEPLGQLEVNLVARTKNHYYIRELVFGLAERRDGISESRMSPEKGVEHRALISGVFAIAANQCALSIRRLFPIRLCK